MRQQREQPVLDHCAAPGDAEDLVVTGKTGAVEPPPQRRDDRRPCRRAGPLAGKRGAQRRGGLERQANRPHPVFLPDLDDEPRDGRMQVEMLVRVDVIEHETGGAKRAELGADFGGELAPGARREREAEAGAYHVRIEGAIGPGQRRDLRRRQYGRAIGQHQVQADAEPRKPPGPRHRVGGFRRADHQARRGQDAIRMGLLDCLVDRDVAAEIVGANDKPSHGLSPRRRPGPTFQQFERLRSGSRLSPG